MNKTQADKNRYKFGTADWLILIGISLVLAGVPLAFTGQFLSFYWSTTLKLAIFILGLFFMLIGSALNFKKEKAYFLPRSIIVPLLFVVAISVGASLTGKNPIYSFVGFQTPGRGLLVQLFLYVFFLITFDFITRRPDASSLLVSVLIAGSVFVSLVAIYQGAVLGWNRVSSTLGNPVFLAAYTGMVIWFAVAGLLNKKDDRESRLLYLISILWIVAAFALAYTRSGWISLAISGLFFYFFCRRVLKSKKSLVFILAGIIFVVLITGLFQTAREGRLKKGSQFFGRIQETLSGSSGARRELWKSTAYMVADKPFSGQGVDSFIFVSPEFLSKSVLKSEFTGNQTEMFYFDPHNLIINQAINAGLIGLAAFLWLIITFFLFFVKKINTLKKERIVAVAAAASLGGYLINLLFQPDYFQTSAIAFFSMALALSYFDSTKVNLKNKNFLKILTAIFIVLLIFESIQIAADYYYQASFSSNDSANIESSLSSVKLAPYRLDYIGHLAGVYLRAYSRGEDNYDLKEAIKFSKMGLKKDKENPLFYVLLSRAYLESGELKNDTKYLIKSMVAAKEAEKLYPAHPEPKYLLGRALLDLKRYKKSVFYLKAAAEVHEDSDILKALYQSYEGLGDKKAANKYFRRYKETLSER
jgi:O-antigen ligase